jgi:hypothetical protein
MSGGWEMPDSYATPVVSHPIIPHYTDVLSRWAILSVRQWLRSSVEADGCCSETIA